MENIRFVERHKKNKMMMPNGRQIRAGDVFDPDAYGLSESYVARMIKNRTFVAVGDEAPTQEPGPTSYETAAAALEPQNNPSESWTRPAIMEYLDAYGVSYDSRANKADLLVLAESCGAE